MSLPVNDIDNPGRRPAYLLEKRTEPRVPADAVVKVIALEAPFRDIDARLCNISRNGLGLVLPDPIYPGSRVCVSWGRMAVFGEIRHCNPLPDGKFFAGVRTEQAIVGGGG